MSQIKKNIQKNIAQFRKQAGLTQKDLAARIGVPVTSLASWEQGKSLPDIDTLFALCSHLGTDIVTISGFELPTPDPNDKNGFHVFFDGVNAMNAHCAKLGSELSLLADEQQLIEDYRCLNDQGQEYIRQTMHMAKQTYKKMPDISDLENQA